MNNKTLKVATALSLCNEELSPTDLKESEILRHYLQAATSDNTRKAYRSAIRQFEKWGGRLPTERDTIVSYLLTRAESINPPHSGFTPYCDQPVAPLSGTARSDT